MGVVFGVDALNNTVLSLGGNMTMALEPHEQSRVCARKAWCHHYVDALWQLR